MAAPKKLQAKKLVAEKHEADQKFSLDEQIGKGLTPKKEHGELDQMQKDFALHPKFSKFKTAEEQ